MQHYYHLTQNDKLRNALPVYVNSYAYNYHQKPWQYKNGSLVNHVYLIISGSGVAETEFQNITFGKGDILFFKSNTPISYGPENDLLITRFFTFGGFACESLFNLYEIPEVKVFSNAKTANLISEFCQLAENGLSDEALSAKLYPLILELCNCIKGYTIPENLEKTLEYIKKNISKDISINELCEISNTSRSVLFKLFKKNLNATPVHYINNIKIDLAKAYLESSRDLSIENISKEVGFSSTSYFIETFKKITDTTPAKFRKERLG